MKRQVVDEILDGLSPQDPLALQSRQDLRRLNRIMGNNRRWRRVFQNFFPTPKRAPKLLIELGAGDGMSTLEILRPLSSGLWSGNVGRLLFIDLNNPVSPETVQAFAEINWQVETIQSDAVAWMHANPELLGASDLIFANLFLHHFEASKLKDFLLPVQLHARRFHALEPRRSRLALFLSSRVGWIGCNSVTQNDAPVSVIAGFKDHELSEIWNQRHQDEAALQTGNQPSWKLSENPHSFSSHEFSAVRELN